MVESIGPKDYIGFASDAANMQLIGAGKYLLIVLN